MKQFITRIALAAAGAAVAEIGQFASPRPMPLVTGIGLAILIIGAVVAIGQLGRAQGDRDPRERSMWVVLSVVALAVSATWLYLPAHSNGQPWESIWSIHALCSSGAYDAGPCASMSIDVSWWLGIVGLVLGAMTGLLGWYITSFEPLDEQPTSNDIHQC